MQLAPRGDALYFVKLDSPGVWRTDAAGGPAELVLPGLDLADWGSWVVAEGGIYHLTRGPTAIVCGGAVLSADCKALLVLLRLCRTTLPHAM